MGRLVGDHYTGRSVSFEHHVILRQMSAQKKGGGDLREGCLESPSLPKDLCSDSITDHSDQ
jgi:hypothetical protein